MATLEIQKDKAPVGVVAAVRTDGRKIPFIMAGTETIGDVIQRDTDGTVDQAIGVVTDVGAEFNDIATAKAANPTPVLADHREDGQMQITGLIYAPLADATYVDGEDLTWTGTTFAANATGAHKLVGPFTSLAADGTHAVVDINKIPRAKT